MNKQDKNLIINFFTEKENYYNKQFIKNLYRKFTLEKNNILETLNLNSIQQVTINLYDNQEDFIDSIKSFYNDYNIPAYCKGTIQNWKIFFLVNTKLEEGTYKYDLELRKIIHEYIHILYNEYLLNGQSRVTWLDEGLALNLSKERGRFEKQKYPILTTNIENIDLNILQHENGIFVTKEVNGYDVSYLVVKYLLETLSLKDFNILIRQSQKLIKIRKNCLDRSKKILRK